MHGKNHNANPQTANTNAQSEEVQTRPSPANGQTESTPTPLPNPSLPSPSRTGSRQAKRATKPPSKAPPTAQKLDHPLAQRLLRKTTPAPPKQKNTQKTHTKIADAKRPDDKDATTKFPSVLALLQPAVGRE